MKAKQSFTVYMDDKNNFVPHYSGDSMDGKTKIDVLKGKDVPDFIVADLLGANPDYLEMEYEQGRVKISDEELVRYGMKSAKIERPPVIEPRYSQETLTKIFNEKGIDGLLEIAKKFGIVKFSPKKNPIMEVLKAQEKSRRERKV